MKFIRRTTTSDYIEDQTVTIGAGGGSDNVENLLKGTDLEALEVELDDGSVYVLVGFKRK